MTYRPFDQEEKLGPPPWDPLAEAVADWERAHGHDVRRSCDSVALFGCRVNESYERGYGEGYRDGWAAAKADERPERGATG